MHHAEKTSNTLVPQFSARSINKSQIIDEIERFGLVGLKQGPPERA
jgi:hypothetical protein